MIPFVHPGRSLHVSQGSGGLQGDRVPPPESLTAWSAARFEKETFRRIPLHFMGFRRSLVQIQSPRPFPSNSPWLLQAADTHGSSAVSRPLHGPLSNKKGAAVKAAPLLGDNLGGASVYEDPLQSSPTWFSTTTTSCMLTVPSGGPASLGGLGAGPGERS
jgi:hypothetical protein